ncbi:MAG: hypothetical protein ACPHCV_05465 [Pseudohongiellaceae bacterium]
MKRIELLLTVGAFLLISDALAQGGPPPGYVDTSQRQMAEIQAQMRYGQYLDALDTTAQRKAEIGSVITTVFLERNEASRNRTSGVISSVSLEELSSPAYLRGKVAELLTDRELRSFDEYEASFQERVLRSNFTRQLARVSGGLTEANQEIVLEVLMRYMGAGQEQVNRSNRDAVDESQRQMQTLMDARMELSQLLSDSQMQEAEKFLGQIITGLMTTQSMNEAEL